MNEQITFEYTCSCVSQPLASITNLCSDVKSSMEIFSVVIDFSNNHILFLSFC